MLSPFSTQYLSRMIISSHHYYSAAFSAHTALTALCDNLPPMDGSSWTLLSLDIIITQFYFYISRMNVIILCLTSLSKSVTQLPKPSVTFLAIALVTSSLPL